MPKLRAINIAISLDGYAAAPNQSLENPIGVGGSRLHEWVFATKSGLAMIGESGGEEGIDNDFLAHANDNIGATIMGRNMFGPIRGPWTDDEWKGWWGPNPPYHHPVFVLTNHPRESIPMEGGTTFHFITDGIESPLNQAFAAAGGKDVRLGGGASTIQQYLRAGFLDELHVCIVPILLGSGERLFTGLEQVADLYERAEMISSPAVTHMRLVRKS